MITQIPKLIPFTDPMTAVRLKLLLADPNKFEAYQRWFKERWLKFMGKYTAFIQ